MKNVQKWKLIIKRNSKELEDDKSGKSNEQAEEKKKMEVQQKLQEVNKKQPNKSFL